MNSTLGLFHATKRALAQGIEFTHKRTDTWLTNDLYDVL